MSGCAVEVEGHRQGKPQAKSSATLSIVNVTDSGANAVHRDEKIVRTTAWTKFSDCQ